MTRLATIVLAMLFSTASAGALAGVIAGQMPWEYAVSLAAFPAGAAVAATILFARGRQAIVLAWSWRLFSGATAGLAATLVYDVYRVAVRYVLAIAFDPFRVQPVFGRIITGLPSTHPVALLSGWSYHLWIGLLIGMIFIALRPRGGVLVGALFAAVLQLGRWVMYPDVFWAGFSDREFFANGVLGQLLWGVVLGLVSAWLYGRFTNADQKVGISS